jgi:hypothetical protein
LGGPSKARPSATRIATAAAIGMQNANGMDAAIQSSPDSGGFAPRCGFDADEKKEIMGESSTRYFFFLFRNIDSR